MQHGTTISAARPADWSWIQQDYASTDDCGSGLSADGAQITNHVFRGNDIAILRVDIEKVGIVRAIVTITDTVAGHDDTIAVLDGVDGAGSNAAAG